MHTPLLHLPHLQTVRIPCIAQMPGTLSPCLSSQNSVRTTVLSPLRSFALYYPHSLLPHSYSTFFSQHQAHDWRTLFTHASQSIQSAKFEPVCSKVVAIQIRITTSTYKPRLYRHHPNFPVTNMASAYVICLCFTLCKRPQRLLS